MKASDTFPSICVVAAALFAAYGARADATYDESTGWSGLSGTVTIPSGVTAPLADGDLADFANVTSVVFESSTSKISASGLSDPIVLNAALNIAAVVCLPQEWRHVGLAASTSFCSFAGCLLFALAFIRQIRYNTRH